MKWIWSDHANLPIGRTGQFGACFLPLEQRLTNVGRLDLTPSLPFTEARLAVMEQSGSADNQSN